MEADSLGDSVQDVSTATAEQAWALLWDKPIYAFRSAIAARRWVNAISGDMLGAWKRMGDLRGDFEISFVGGVGKGGWARNEAYAINGKGAIHLSDDHRIPAKTIFAIVGAGRALNRRATSSDCPFSDLTRNSVAENIAILKREFGPGWGHVSVCHFLTDLGLACKPDIHLVRTMKVLGLFDGTTDQVTQSQALKVVAQCYELCKSVYGNTKGRSLRRLDKQLMDISARGIVQNPFAASAQLTAAAQRTL